MHACKLIKILFPLLLLAFSCSRKPEIMIVNNTSENTLIVNPSYNGVRWFVTLKYGESTSPEFVLPGKGEVHFQKFNAHEYCRSTFLSSDTDIVSQTPLYFNYKTISQYDVNRGEFIRVEITHEDMEQDFSVPGPYGH